MGRFLILLGIVMIGLAIVLPFSSILSLVGDADTAQMEARSTTAVAVADDLVGSGLISIALSIAGVGLMVVGVLMMRNTTHAPDIVGVARPPTPSVGVGLSSDDAAQAGYGGHDSQSVVSFVRDQLDSAFRSGQMSREDYERAIEKLDAR